MAEGKSRTILKATVSNYLRQGTQILTFLLLTPFIVHAVGKEQFGLWSLIQATVGLLGLMDLGLGTSVVKYVADARGRQDSERVGRITATLFWVYVIMGLVVTGVAVAVAPMLPRFFRLEGQDAVLTPLIFLLVALRSAQALPLGMFLGVLVAYQRQVISNSIRAFGTVSYALAAWWALTYQPSLVLLAWVTLASGLFANLLAMGLCLAKLPEVRIHPRCFQRTMVREVSTFSTWYFLIQISLLLATRIDLILIKLFLPLSAAAYYAVAMRVTEQASVLCRQFSTALTPMIAELKGAGEEANLRQVFRRGGQVSFALAAPVLVSLMVLAEAVIRAWLGPNYGSAVLPLQILLGAALVSCAHSHAENMLAMTGHQKFLALGMVGTQVFNAILTVILIPHLGIVGSAAATLTASIAMQGGLVARRACQSFGLSLWQFYSLILGPSLLGILMLILVLEGFLHYGPQPNLLGVAAYAVVGMATFGVTTLFLGLGKEDRQYYISRLKSRKSKRLPQPAPPTEDGSSPNP